MDTGCMAGRRRGLLQEDGLLRVVLPAMVLLVLLAGCGLNTGGEGTSSPGTGLAPGGLSSLAPSATDRPAGPIAPRQAPEPARVAVLMRVAGEGQVSLALRALSVARAGGRWHQVATAKVVRKIAGQPAALETVPRLLAVGRVPAGVYERVRVVLGSGRQAGWLAREGEPRQTLQPAAAAFELACPTLTLAPGELGMVVIALDPAQLRPARNGSLAVTARCFAVSEPAPEMLGAISGEVAPAGAVATVHTCLAATGEVLGKAAADVVSGRFTLAALPPGEYYLSLEAPGFACSEDQTRRLHVKAGQTLILEPVALTPIAPRP